MPSASIDIKIITNSKRPEIVGWRNNRLVIKLKNKPIQGAANRELINLLSDHCDWPKNKIKIKFGLTNANKTVLFDGLMPQKLKSYFD
jgi:uncharacterized protein YggU (UPF0235/DUF167 family)